MSKPIFIVRVPRQYFSEEIEMLEKVRLQLKEELSDYHVLLMTESTTDRTEFECHNTADATEETIKEIQDRIFKILEQNNGKI